jgi:hypothetical protein
MDASCIENATRLVHKIKFAAANNEQQFVWSDCWW